MDAAFKINLAVLIVNTIAAFTAVVAAIVAIRGNTQARQAAQTSEEQFQTNMQELNRLINVSLFDLRSEILGEVKPGGFEFDRTRARMLFNAEVSELIKEYDIEYDEASRLRRLKREYLETVRQGLSDDTYEETADFLEYISNYDSMDPQDMSEDVFKQVQDSIRRHGLTGKWINGASPDEAEYVDYISVSEEYSRHCRLSEDICKRLHVEMEQFIEASIR